MKTTTTHGVIPGDPAAVTAGAATNPGAAVAESGAGIKARPAGGQSPLGLERGEQQGVDKLGEVRPTVQPAVQSAVHSGARTTGASPADVPQAGRRTRADGATEAVDRLPVKQFMWGAGIECSFIPHLNVDQFKWTQHDRFWRDDFKRFREELGMTYLRYSLPWHQIETSKGQFDWSMADERLAECEKLGIKLLLDVMHFGTPLWLKQAVGDPEFPEALERYSAAIVDRYRTGPVAMWCPFNEPLVSALFSGDFGFWPPHSRKWRGYMPVLSRIVQAVSRGIRAIRETDPKATILLCDAAEAYKTRVPELKAEVARRNLRRFVVMDLLTGRVDKHHALYSWLVSYGLSEIDLAWFRSNPQRPDVLGLDYYPHSDWELETYGGNVRQRRADNPTGLHGVASAYWARYSVPMMLTETSVEGQPINREIWLESNIEEIRRLREDGVPMLGMFWWPMIDQVDWDGALTHRVGKVHEVGLWHLSRQADGTLLRKPTPLVEQLRATAAAGEEPVGRLEQISYASPEVDDEQLPPVGQWIQSTMSAEVVSEAAEQVTSTQQANGNGHDAALNGGSNGGANGGSNGSAGAQGRLADPAPGLSAEPGMGEAVTASVARGAGIDVTPGGLSGAASSTAGARDASAMRDTGRYGIVVFSHLRWGFVWQRPQQFLSRFAKRHRILFIEEPFFDKPDGAEPDLQFHRVMPNVTVMCPHVSASLNRDPKLPQMMRDWTQQAIERMNDDGAFDRPLLWYYSPMDSSWSLGWFVNRGVVYDCMDELSQFTGAPRQLVGNEARLMKHADIVFTGGYELGEKKRQQHGNVHTFGCGVEFSHFNKAAQSDTTIPPDIDFMVRPIIGWFGVVDERVDYAMVGEMARARPQWSFAMVGPVVKVDPNLLPHAPNLFWMGGRDYQQLPNYCAAFDVCMMPFAMNSATQFINPTKGLEYMATGRPIVGTPVRDVVRQWSDIVRIAKNLDEFLAACDEALGQRGNDPRVKRGLELAQTCSWENTVKRMAELIRDAIGKPDRPSGGKIEPMNMAELEYQYRHTQGS